MHIIFERIDAGLPASPSGQRLEAPRYDSELRRLSLAREACLFVFGAAVGFIIAIGVVL